MKEEGRKLKIEVKVEGCFNCYLHCYIATLLHCYIVTLEYFSKFENYYNLA